MSRTFRRSNADNRYGFDNPKQMGRNRDGAWNGRFSREDEDRELRSKRAQKKIDRRQIQLDSLDD